MKTNLNGKTNSMDGHQSYSPQKSTQGFALIEVLVAMLIAAFGILGIVGMNTTSIKLQADSASRSRAAIHAQDIFDRMRANANSAKAGDYNKALEAAFSATKNPMANQDLVAWLNNLGVDLPSGAAAINVLNTGDATVTIQWAERENRGAVAANVSFTFRSSL